MDIHGRIRQPVTYGGEGFVGDNAPARTEDPEIKRMTSQKVEYVQDGTCVHYSLCLYIFVLWRGETHHYPNISTHLLRLDTPKEKNKNERNDKRKRNDHPLEPHIPKCDQPKHPKELPSKQTKVQEYKGILPKS